MPEDLLAICDASTIRQVLDNLLENALQSIAERQPEGPRIEISARAVSGSVVVDVRDNGTGLAKAAEIRALEPFFTTKDTGIGLGLSISYEIVQAHGGDLKLHNGSAGGAVASVTLPAAEMIPNAKPQLSGMEARS